MAPWFYFQSDYHKILKIDSDKVDTEVGTKGD